jgi:hypothetical protein
MDLKLLFNYLKVILTDKKFWGVVAINLFLSLVGQYLPFQGAILLSILNNLLINSYLVVAVSALYFGKSVEGFRERLHPLPLTSLFQWKVVEVATGILVGEVLLFLILMVVVQGLVTVGALLVLGWSYFIFGKVGTAFASSNFFEGLKQVLSGLYDLGYFKHRIGEYTAYYFLVIFGFMIIFIVMEMGLVLFPKNPLILQLIVVPATTLFYTFSSFLGYLAVEGGKYDPLL